MSISHNLLRQRRTETGNRTDVVHISLSPALPLGQTDPVSSNTVNMVFNVHRNHKAY